MVVLQLGVKDACRLATRRLDVIGHSPDLLERQDERRL